MLGPMGSHLMSILQVLTPAEIDLYTKKAREKFVRAPMAAGAEELDISYSGGNYAERYPSSGSEEKDEGNTHQDAPDTKDESSQLAKIIPLHQNFETQTVSYESEELARDFTQNLDQNINHDVSQADEDFSKNAKEKNELESIGVYSADTIRKKRIQESDEKRRSQPSASVFLINERKKMQSSQNKLREQTALKNYQKNAYVDTVKREIDLDDDLDREIDNSTGVAGILVNKRQF